MNDNTNKHRYTQIYDLRVVDATRRYLSSCFERSFTVSFDGYTSCMHDVLREALYITAPLSCPCAVHRMICSDSSELDRAVSLRLGPYVDFLHLTASYSDGCNVLGDSV